ncbi:flagellar hook protein FlgE [Falsirhodobacter sp. alg1]|uniref:flagellar hook protein FlgE n=1 Tax=Falsirhodobacter sp. alg1 TaxID=1472418 RepID=UPI0005EE747E|nr:flagellar hook-basal body complex protein [Falsirhodobacter sp. alg1]
MTITSSLNAGVSGLNANAARLAGISDNIANSGTYGYKRAETDFFQMVNAGNNAGSYSAGGVRTTALRMVDEQGALVGTTNSTDISIDGRGFLPVSPDEGDAVTLTTTGSFRTDANGVLKTESGLTLMGWAANADGTIPAVARESMSGLEPVKINMNQFISNPTTRMALAVNLPATATQPDAAAQSYSQTIEYYDSLGTAQSMTVDFTSVPATGGTASNAWMMRLTDDATSTVLGDYRMVFDDSQQAGGTLESVTRIAGSGDSAKAGTYDADSGTINLKLSGGNVSFSLGKPGQTTGMSQLSDTYAPSVIEKDGSAVGSLQSIEVDDNGYVRAQYDQGFSRVLYQVPVVDVPNPNGLRSLDNQTFSITADSGAFYLWDAGDGPTGSTKGFTREQSTTDVAEELTQLIQTQNAYSSNAKIIQTVDEMLQETTNLKR